MPTIVSQFLPGAIQEPGRYERRLMRPGSFSGRYQKGGISPLKESTFDESHMADHVRRLLPGIGIEK